MFRSGPGVGARGQRAWMHQGTQIAGVFIAGRCILVLIIFGFGLLLMGIIATSVSGFFDADNVYSKEFDSDFFRKHGSGRPKTNPPRIIGIVFLVIGGIILILGISAMCYAKKKLNELSRQNYQNEGAPDPALISGPNTGAQYYPQQTCQVQPGQYPPHQYQSISESQYAPGPPSYSSGPYPPGPTGPAGYPLSQYPSEPFDKRFPGPPEQFPRGPSGNNPIIAGQNPSGSPSHYPSEPASQYPPGPQGQHVPAPRYPSAPPDQSYPVPSQHPSFPDHPPVYNDTERNAGGHFLPYPTEK